MSPPTTPRRTLWAARSIWRGRALGLSTGQPTNTHGRQTLSSSPPTKSGSRLPSQALAAFQHFVPLLSHPGPGQGGLPSSLVIHLVLWRGRDVESPVLTFIKGHHHHQKLLATRCSSQSHCRLRPYFSTARKPNSMHGHAIAIAPTCRPSACFEAQTLVHPIFFFTLSQPPIPPSSQPA